MKKRPMIAPGIPPPTLTKMHRKILARHQRKSNKHLLRLTPRIKAKIIGNVVFNAIIHKTTSATPDGIIPPSFLTPQAVARISASSHEVALLP
jgi:hypothetical protein